MFIRLFAALLVVAVAGAQRQVINNLSELMAKDVDGHMKQFRDVIGQCWLFVNTASRDGMTKSTMQWLKQVEKDTPKIYLTAVPSNSFGNEPKSNELLSEWMDIYDVFDEVLEKQDITTSPLYQFLARQSGAYPRGNYWKFLVWKDGLKVTWYDETDGPVESRKIQHDLNNCQKS